MEKKHQAKCNCGKIFKGHSEISVLRQRARHQSNTGGMCSKIKEKKDIRKDIKELDGNITNVVSREDGTLEINVKKQLEDTRKKVARFINERCLTDCFTKIDFHEVGEGA